MDVTPDRARTILVVEDEDLVRNLIIFLLREEGYAILEARNADEASKQCQELPGKIDLLITDMVLPGVQGLELFQTLKATEPFMRGLFISGYPDKPPMPSGLDAAFLRKPFDPQSLITTVEGQLQRRAAD